MQAVVRLRKRQGRLPATQWGIAELQAVVRLRCAETRFVARFAAPECRTVHSFKSFGKGEMYE